ncbi:DNA-directed RNA polymerase subunit B [Encephalitozoon romaleae SJ-2008]|uniref:DNA-directed RNA polymerase subunit beta n=1 Tax=Encephalitozoon romaleae (strain SJ-2008) TaxID=1178016 RepID=I7ALY0_ENCRO|nr:DNA-directed RNA polymerase subunit B [Encephalitozoon romaleae SJ-2008]AFN82654.1 DNA-directed RNA polymerase subunit B [Encephalitozoon romaleae SJ-2008]
MELKDAAKAHIEAYNAIFDENILDNLVAGIPPLIRGRTKIVVEEIHISPPFLSDRDHISVDRRLFPRECRERGLTYKGKMVARVSLFYDNKHVMTEDKFAGYFPIMVRSKLCHLRNVENMNKVGEDEGEVGGYFIVNGIDKFIRLGIIQKRNHIFAFKQRKKENFLTGYGVSIRCVGKDEIGHLNSLYYCTDGNVIIKIFYRRSTFLFPLVLILRALINTTDEELFEALGGGEKAIHLLKCFAEYNVFSRAECLDYIGSRFSAAINVGTKVEAAKELLSKYVASHLTSNLDKFNFLVLAAKKLFSFVDNEIVEDDFDSPGNHELFTVTQVLSSFIKDKIEEYMRLFPIIYKKTYFKDGSGKRKLEKDSEVEDDLYEDKLDLSKIKEIFKKTPINIGQKLDLFLYGGSTVLTSCSDILQRTGFVITAERINFYRYLCNLRSINRGSYISSLVTDIRKLRPESWGFICPVHTPDGAPCGILLHMAKGAEVVSKAEDFDIDVLFEFGVVPVIRGVRMDVPVLVDGKVIGSTSSPHTFVRMLREYKVKNNLKIEIVYSEGPKMFPSVCVFNSMGRFTRKVMNRRLNSEEWIGIMEQVFLNIDVEKGKGEGDYYEIDKTDILGILAGLTPYSDHNQSPRNMYQCQMAKQAIGLPAYNIKARVDSSMYTINYLQSPIVRTKGYDLVKDYPVGVNCMVAVLSYTAYDMEDALVISKNSIDRGLFTGYVYKTEKVSLEKGHYFTYLLSVGKGIERGSVLYRYVDQSGREYESKYYEAEGGIIDSVRVFDNDIGERCATFTIRIVRNPSIGDKFSSRHGQKGVCSMHWPTVDMPFTESGYVPDIIINPHAFPSRMTIGMLIESIAGKVGCLSGSIQDGTAFEKSFFSGEDENGKEKEYLCEELQRHGFNYYGNEPMYSGISGNEFRVDVFVGVVYYQRLKHMVGDKFQVRTTGPVVSTTQQPIGGKKKQGGIRFGEMERDALISHGASHLLQDRLLKCSDGTIFEYCGVCKSILFTNNGDCVCGSNDLKIVEMPYVFKYLCYELLAMNIKVKIDL